MKAIMYHYVRSFDESYPNFRFLDFNNFQKQLDYFENEFGIVTRADWEDFALRGETSGGSNEVILTFDDAMSCHYEFVFRELKKRRLCGIFYVPTRPYTDEKMLDVHRIHLLCGRFEGRKLLEICNALITEEMIPFQKREEFKNRTYTRQSNYEGVSEFKRLLNYFVDESHKADVIDEISNILDFDEYDTSFYVSEQDLKKMSQEGMIMGSHTVNHPVMSKLDPSSQKSEISLSFDFLESICGTTHRTYCHPYGGFHSFDDHTVELLNEHNVAYSFNVESRDITAEDVKSNRQHLPRYDCNQFRFGSAS